jgi:hypothetical protein
MARTVAKTEKKSGGSGAAAAQATRACSIRPEAGFGRRPASAGGRLRPEAGFGRVVSRQQQAGTGPPGRHGLQQAERLGAGLIQVIEEHRDRFGRRVSTAARSARSAPG